MMRNFLLVLLAALPALATAQPPEYPRMVEGDGLVMKVHHPVIDRWPDYAALEGWIPVEVTDGQGTNWVGAVRARAGTTVDLDQRLVHLESREVLSTRFADPRTPEPVKAFAASAIQGGRQSVLLDEVLLSLADDFEPPVQERSGRGFNTRPPRIVVSETPVRLLLIDKEPVRAPIEGTELEVVVNTNWDLFYYVPSRSWYVINDGVWQTQSLLSSGEWSTTAELPPDFSRLATGERWSNVREALPPRVPAVAPAPLLVSLEATELIVIDGEAVLQAIPGAGGLSVVANSEQDLFFLDGRWYFLTSGRWFSTASLDGRWEAVSDLPDAFGKIPPDHGRAHVRRSVPGTLEAALAYIEATLPQRKIVAAGSAPGREIFYVGEPRFEPIAETRVARAVNTPFAVIQHNNAYYLNHEAAWYRAERPTGPWRATTVVPEAIFSIPPSDPLYPVTFVRPAGNQPSGEEARFSYTEGYNGMYTIGRRAVEGTGWSYQPWIAYPPTGPVYWGYPHTYGWPRYGYWGAPWYGGVYLPPQTLEFESGERGPRGMPAAPSEQDPGLTRRGYDYSTLAQQRGDGGELSQYLADDLYADPQGQVYRRSEEGWSRHAEDGWGTMAELERQYGVKGPEVERPESGQRQAYRQNEDDIKRMERYYDRRARSYNMYSNIYVRH